MTAVRMACFHIIIPTLVVVVGIRNEEATSIVVLEDLMLRASWDGANELFCHVPPGASLQCTCPGSAASRGRLGEDCRCFHYQSLLVVGFSLGATIRPVQIA